MYLRPQPQLRVSTDPAYWRGVIPVPVSGLPGAGDLVKAKEPVDDYNDWFRHCQPALNQSGESCVGWGWTHWLAAMIRRYVDPAAFLGGWQLDGQAVWRRGREMFWNGTFDAGLYLPQGFAALKDLQMVPSESEIIRVATDWDSVGLALLDTPIVQAHAIHAGWFKARTDNGCLDHEPAASEANGCHCTLRIARVRQDLRKFYSFQNSWGAEWGFGGYGLMTVAEDAEGIMSPGLYTARLPERWKSCDGWKALMVRA